ncbi:hypothetical protein D3C86_1834860 [compost metagenome]
MQYGADQQQTEQNEGEALGTLGVNLAIPCFKFGAAHQRVGKNKPAGQESQNRPPPGEAHLRYNEHGKAC